MGAGPVITADYTVCDGLVIRWRRRVQSEPVLSASRHSVMIHGSVILDSDLKRWITDAEHARDALTAGREGEARAMATHRWTRMLGGDLAPIKAAARETNPAAGDPVPTSAEGGDG